MNEIGEFGRDTIGKYLAWRIIIQPSQVVKEMYRWEKITEIVGGKIIEFWNRVDSISVPLKFEIVNGVSISDGFIHFDGNGSYLRIKDRGLAHDIEFAWGLTIGKKSESEGISQERHESNRPMKLYGKNIQVEAELDVHDNGIKNPILFVETKKPETTKQLVCLSVNTSNNMQQTIWEISDQYYETHPYKLSGNYFLAVSQDRDRRPEVDEPTYFEFFADGIPLKVDLDTQIAKNKESGYTKKTHIFSNRDVDWYIGYDPRSGQSLKGSIRRLVFDPNASCPGCT